MLKVIIPSIEFFDEGKNSFFNSKEYELQLEHSLVSLAKWESTWHKPFLIKENKTDEETIDYIKAMTITQNVDPQAYTLIKQPVIDKILNYINDPMTATTINKQKEVTKSGIVTAEIIYYWMVTFNIPFDCQKWHLNRLLTLIDVCNIKNTPVKKRSKKEIYEQNRAINESRKAKLKSEG
jgi:hypothetical protein